MRRPFIYIAHATLASLVPMLALALAACVQDDPITAPSRPAPNQAASAITHPPGSQNDLIAITAGAEFTCALKRNQHVYCWGLNEALQAGVATGSCTATIGANWCVSTPQQVMDTSTKSALLAIQIDAGYWHACALRSDATAVCWGYDDVGQIGINSPLVQASFPSPVFGGVQFESIGAGGESSCGTTYLNGVLCWGYINSALAPTAMSGTVAGSPNYYSVAVGADHYCVMDYTNNVYGAVSCEGKNQFGQVATTITNGGWWSQFSQSWFGTSVNHVVTEGNFTCVDQSSGIVQCAGDDTYGTLGVFTSGASSSTPTPQTVGWNVFRHAWTTLHGVTASPNHACALDQNSYAWCWGDNDMGQLGYSTSATFSASPWPIAGNITFRALAAGYEHTCGISTNNLVYCWGSNAYGEFGNGMAGGSTSTPTKTVAF